MPKRKTEAEFAVAGYSPLSCRMVPRVQPETDKDGWTLYPNGARALKTGTHYELSICDLCGEPVADRADVGADEPPNCCCVCRTEYYAFMEKEMARIGREAKKRKRGK